MATEDELKALREASESAATEARALLDDELKTVMDEVARISELKPETADDETYQKLIAVVQEATARNHSIATLKQNVQNLGEGAVELFKTMAAIAKKLA